MVTERTGATAAAPPFVLLTSVRAVATNGTVAVLIATLTLTLPGLIEPPTGMLRIVAITIGVSLAALMQFAPWERWIDRGHAMAWLVAAMSIASVTVAFGVAASGGSVSRYVWMWGLQMLFAGILLPVPLLLGFGAQVLVLYGVAAWWHGGILLGEFAFRAAVLGLVAAMARTVTVEWARANQLAADRQRTLTMIAEAGRALPELAPDEVLEEVAERVCQMGYDLAGIYVEDGDGGLRYAASRGIPEALQGRRFPRDGGVVGQVLATGTTVTEPAYATSPFGHADYRALGVVTAIGTPIHTSAGIAGVVVAGTLTPHNYEPHDAHALELLAGVAGRALETSRTLREQAVSLRQLLDLERVRGDLVATVSHELRTPLTVISGSASTVIDRWDVLDDDVKLDLLRRLRSNAETLDTVIGSLLDLARLEGGGLDTRLERFDLAGLVRDVLERLAPVVETHRVTATGTEHPVAAHGDAQLLERVVENLLSNATRHTPPGTPVEVRLVTIGQRVAFEVRDEGPGIPETELARLGERFYRGGQPTRRSTRGVGIGLALAVRVLALHDTELEIESEVGRGSTFRFTLPRAPRHLTDQRIGRPAAASASVDDPQT